MKNHRLTIGAGIVSLVAGIMVAAAPAAASDNVSRPWQICPAGDDKPACDVRPAGAPAAGTDEGATTVSLEHCAAGEARPRPTTKELPELKIELILARKAQQKELGSDRHLLNLSHQIEQEATGTDAEARDDAVDRARCATPDVMAQSVDVDFDVRICTPGRPPRFKVCAI